MKPYRTVLFVPAHKTSWYDKAAESGADAVCFDLEDSVPAHLKAAAREEVAAGIERLSKSAPRDGPVRALQLAGHRPHRADLEATVGPGLTGIFAPKVDTAIDVIRYDTLLDHFEARNGVTGSSTSSRSRPSTASRTARRSRRPRRGSAR